MKYMAKKKRKPVDLIIYELMQRVSGEYFAKNPLKVFPGDFLSDEVKKDLAKPIKYPDLFKFGITVTGRDHKIRRKVTKNKINLEEVRKTYELSKMADSITEAKYVEVLLPPGEKMKLWAEKNFGIYFEKSKIFKEFSSLEEAKYLLYSRKSGKTRSASSGQAKLLMYKVPKDEAAVKRAVAEYEKYMGQVYKGLIKAFMAIKRPKEAAETMARLVMKEIGFPSLQG